MHITKEFGKHENVHMTRIGKKSAKFRSILTKIRQNADIGLGKTSFPCWHVFCDINRRNSIWKLRKGLGE
ncbi:MAG: hypothetical protein C6P36_08005 [Geobacillus sp.]|nr:MAG: hypothetical protein C6P36_08005 [Geobacillus sp.]